MIDPRARLLLFLMGLAVLLLAINLVRKRQLQERYALLWLLAGLVLVLAPLFVNAIDRLAEALGFGYPPALLLMLAVIGLMLIIAQLSLSISNQAERIKVLTQELGLLRTEVAELKAKLIVPTPSIEPFPPIVIRDQVGVCGVRDDSRTVAEVAAAAPRAGRALDLGTGTGYVGLYLAQRGWQVDAVDISPRAVELARANAAANGVEMAVYVSNLFEGVSGSFDVIAFNPPMRPDETEASRVLTSLLRRSPRISRFLMQVGGDRFEGNRMGFLKHVVDQARQRLTPSGRLILAINTREILEIGAWPGVRLLRKVPLPGMEPQEVAEFQFEGPS